ncbi:trimeric intracellular cation channel family protein [Brevibacterium samyangense]|uniref:trimeric intracellular cation channel family protein n=1 Tax=Brevibacterium samyangense TaxID=366888 RepID=UPI0031D6E5C2
MDIPGAGPLADTFLLLLDLFGVLVFAVSGNLLAVRKDYDFTGSVLLGFLAGLGGGMVRDVLLGRVPASLLNPIYLVVPVLAALVVYLVGQHVERVRAVIIACDAVGLGLFCMTGTVITLGVGLGIAPALFMGVLTAAGGGILRDVVANENPAVFNSSDLYLVPALAGSALTAVVFEAGVWNVWTALAVGAFVVVFRLAALRFRWRVPAPMRSWSWRGRLRRLRRRSR